jgi:hypothetical protein
MMKRWSVLISLAIASGCATSPESTRLSPRPFHISSEAGDFGIRGTLSGTVEIQPHDLVVVVKDGTIVSSVGEEVDVTLAPMIAGPGEEQLAEIVKRGQPQTIGRFAKDERRSMNAPLTFTMPLPANFNPATQWLVFEFRLPGQRTAYVCEVGNLLGTRVWGTLREGGHCWSTPTR